MKHLDEYSTTEMYCIKADGIYFTQDKYYKIIKNFTIEKSNILIRDDLNVITKLFSFYKESKNILLTLNVKLLNDDDNDLIEVYSDNNCNSLFVKDNIVELYQFRKDVNKYNL